MAERHSFFVPTRHPCAPDWQPPVDVYRCPRGGLVKVDLAGVRRDEIRVSCRQRQLVITGERRDCRVIDGQQAYSMEICYSQFERRIELPVEIEQLDIQVDYRDGMLLISLSQEGSS